MGGMGPRRFREVCRAERRSAKGERRSPLQVLINGRASAARPYLALNA
jgi:hypothetical protein